MQMLVDRVELEPPTVCWKPEWAAVIDPVIFAELDREYWKRAIRAQDEAAMAAMIRWSERRVAARADAGE